MVLKKGIAGRPGGKGPKVKPELGFWLTINALLVYG